MKSDTEPEKKSIHDPQGGKKYTIEQLRTYAKEIRGGDCLATSYKNSKIPIPWICLKGHTWEATADSVLNMGSWCPNCGGQPHITINDARALAKDRNGRCLSKKYINSYTPLRWECTHAHRFKATYSKVRGTPKKKGTWCPACAQNQRKSLKEEQVYAKSRGWKCIATEYINNRTALPYQCRRLHIWHERPDALRRRLCCPACIKEKRAFKKAHKPSCARDKTRPIAKPKVRHIH